MYAWDLNTNHYHPAIRIAARRGKGLVRQCATLIHSSASVVGVYWCHGRERKGDLNSPGLGLSAIVRKKSCYPGFRLLVLSFGGRSGGEFLSGDVEIWNSFP